MTGLRGELRHRLMLRVDDLPHPKRVLLTRALTLAENIHEGQFRKPSKLDPELREPYIVHPMRVALILFEELGIKDTEAICAAILHDVVEDSNGRVTTNDLEHKFGRIIALMVSVLTKPAADKKIPREAQLKTYHERIAQAAIPTRLVKLSDRLDNMRECVGCNDPVFQQRYLVETRHEYLPIAEATDAYLHEELVALCDKLEELLKSA
ncbi:MAG TPA: HD domain-containing protein [Drouetiella sp.]|jgi:GTP diphosphokinase / guanosine-3',5'-bis(diphosphate) 3'-diphosphatase